MTLVPRIAAAAVLAAVSLAGAVSAQPGTPAAAPGAIPNYWQTRAERTGYRQTADYDETMRYCRLLAGGSRWIKLTSYGTSGQGRELPLIILSKDGAFTPEAARATGKPIVLVQNGIHSGEVEGKDASLALLRDIAVLRTRESLADSAIVLVLPIFSVDAHERRGRFNRINQNGPEEMGWRATPVGLNLNRDYLKAETPEMRALLSQVFTVWWPDLLVDNHTTDGADYRHDVTYSFNHGAGMPASLDRWLAEAFEGRTVDRLRAMGHLPAPYISFKSGNDPASGLVLDNSRPRYSTGYPPLHGRAAILVETHMLKPYERRVRATYDLLVAVLEELRERPRALRDAVREAEAEIIARDGQRDPARRDVVLHTVNSDRSVPFDYKGVRTRWETSPITGARVPRYSSQPWDTTIALYRETVPSVTTRQPAGYFVPQEWTVARDLLDVHGVRYRRLARVHTDSVEVQRVVDWSVEALFEGHRPVTVKKVELVRRLRTWRPGDLWVPLDQPAALVALHLFEAQAPDGLTYWNAFDTVFEQKEYGEDYVIDPIARDMLGADPRLAEAFRAKVAADTAFAHSPTARANFFFTRSRWADPEQNVLPVARALRRPPEGVLAPAGETATR